MLEQNFWIIGLILKILGGLFAFLAALLTFLAVVQNEKHESTKNWFRKNWKRISQSNWLQMPEKIIGCL